MVSPDMVNGGFEVTKRPVVGDVTELVLFAPRLTGTVKSDHTTHFCRVGEYSKTSC